MQITAAATVMPVSDVDRALAFYRDVLGFALDFRFGNYAGVERQGCHLHLSQADNPTTITPGSGCVYLFCDEVDSVYASIVAQGVAVPVPPRHYPYGMRDFVVRDPDGNRLTFGCPTQPE